MAAYHYRRAHLTPLIFVINLFTSLYLFIIYSRLLVALKLTKRNILWSLLLYLHVEAIILWSHPCACVEAYKQLGCSFNPYSHDQLDIIFQGAGSTTASTSTNACKLP